jgi:hypothetical protein
VKVEQNEGMRYSVLLRGKEVIAPSQIDLKVSEAGWLGRELVHQEQPSRADRRHRASL